MKIGNLEIRFFKHKSKKERINDLYDRLCKLAILIDNEDCKINVATNSLSGEIGYLNRSINKETKRAKKEEKKINKSIKSLNEETNWTKDKIANIEKVLFEITSAIDKISKRK